MQVENRLSRLILGPGLRLLGRPRIHGLENIPAAGPAIIASNHLSVLDSLYLPFMVPRAITFVAKSEYFTSRKPIERMFGLYLRKANHLPVDRSGARAGQEMLEAALGVLRQGSLFGIYPEGTRSPDGRLYRGRTGVGWLALHSGVPVVPVAMVGTDRLLPPGHRIPRPRSIEIRVGKPLTFEEFSGDTADARQRRAVTDRVIEAIRELSGQELAPMYASARKEQLAAEAAGASAATAGQSGAPGGFQT